MSTQGSDPPLGTVMTPTWHGMSIRSCSDWQNGNCGYLSLLNGTCQWWRNYSVFKHYYYPVRSRRKEWSYYITTCKISPNNNEDMKKNMHVFLVCLLLCVSAYSPGYEASLKPPWHNEMLNGDITTCLFPWQLMVYVAVIWQCSKSKVDQGLNSGQMFIPLL